jgi:hypothetical protein
VNPSDALWRGNATKSHKVASCTTVVGTGSSNASDSISIDTGVNDASWNEDR